MAEKRSVPTALGIFIGPAIAYLSYQVLNLGGPEGLQLLCFAAFMLAGHDIARGGLSLTGVLTVLMLPALPVAMYLNSLEVAGNLHLAPTMIIGFWAASALLGAVFAGTRPAPGNSVHIVRLAMLAVILLMLVLASFLLL